MLKFHSIRNGHGVNADRERVTFKVTSEGFIGGHMVVDATFNHSGNPSNHNRHLYIFKNNKFIVGDIIHLNTGTGVDSNPIPTRGRAINSTPSEFNFYWGLKSCVWNNSGDVVTVLHSTVVDSKAV